MKIKALTNYKDLVLNKDIEINETYEVEKDRGNYLFSLGLVSVVQETRPKKKAKK